MQLNLWRYRTSIKSFLVTGMDHENYLVFAPSIANVFEGTMCIEAALPAHARDGGAPQKCLQTTSGCSQGLGMAERGFRDVLQMSLPNAELATKLSEIARRERLQFGSAVTTAVPHTKPATSAGLKNMGVLKSCHQGDERPYPISPTWSSLGDSQIF